jgi:hypothetical protein
MLVEVEEAFPLRVFLTSRTSVEIQKYLSSTIVLGHGTHQTVRIF